MSKGRQLTDQIEGDQDILTRWRDRLRWLIGREDELREPLRGEWGDPTLVVVKRDAIGIRDQRGGIIRFPRLPDDPRRWTESVWEEVGDDEWSRVLAAGVVALAMVSEQISAPATRTGPGAGTGSCGTRPGTGRGLSPPRGRSGERTDDGAR